MTEIIDDDDLDASSLSKRKAGSRVVREVFGGPFYPQGRGYYISLEFFAIVKGCLDLEGIEGGDNVLPCGNPVRYTRKTHDFARRLLHGDSPEVAAQIGLPESARALQTLLEGLERSVPGRQKAAPKWQVRHFYPYPPELIHYDAAVRNTKRGDISLERYTYRGGGAFVHWVLRTDPDESRKARIARGLRDLLASSGTALGRIADALAKMDAVGSGSEEPPAVFADEGEARTVHYDMDPRPTAWQELLREGVDNILNRALPKFRRIEALMNWLPLCVAMHQLARANRALGRDEQRTLVVDSRMGSSPVRDKAKQDLRDAVMAVTEAIEWRAKGAGYHVLLEGSQVWRQDPRTFFASTLYACGAINTLKGDRFFSTTPKLLDTVVVALVPNEIPFERFCADVLGARLGFVVDAKGAETRGLSGLESADLETNAEALSQRLGSLGLMREYSDATRMVSVEV